MGEAPFLASGLNAKLRKPMAITGKSISEAICCAKNMDDVRIYKVCLSACYLDI